MRCSAVSARLLALALLAAVLTRGLALVPEVSGARVVSQVSKYGGVATGCLLVTQ